MDGVALALLDHDAVAAERPRIGAGQPRVSIVLPGPGAGGTEHVVNVLANRWPAKGPDSQRVRAFVLLRRLGALLKAIAARPPIVTFDRKVMHAALSSRSAEELSPC